MVCRTRITSCTCSSFFQTIPVGEYSIVIFSTVNQSVVAAGFADFEKSLTYSKLSKLMNAAKSETVDVTIPKFTLDNEYPLKSVLKDGGMESLFDPALADLTGIAQVSTGEKLYVSEAKHKAFIEVISKLFKYKTTADAFYRLMKKVRKLQQQLH